MPVSTVLAKALFDNVSESPDELDFRKGDIVTVLERDAHGLDGWWLCSLHGRNGIAPGNRLRILLGMQGAAAAAGARGHAAAASTPLPPGDLYQVPPSLGGGDLYQVPPSLGGGDLYQVPPSLGGGDLYQVPPSLGGGDLYQVPPSLGGGDIYQVPPSLGGGDLYQVPPSLGGGDLYQVPPSLGGGGLDPSDVHDVYQVPPLPGGSLARTAQRGALHPQVSDLYDFPPPQAHPAVPLAGRSFPPALALQDIYDIPPSLDKSSCLEVYDVPRRAPGGAPAFRDDTYDVPPSFGTRAPHRGVAPACRDDQEAVYDVPPRPAPPAPPAPPDVYDVPPCLARAATPPLPPSSSLSQQQQQQQQQEQQQPDGVYDFPPRVTRDAGDYGYGGDGGDGGDGGERRLPREEAREPVSALAPRKNPVAKPPRSHIQSRPLPPPPPQQQGQLEERPAVAGGDREVDAGAWAEDNDYVHLQGKDDFERQQKEFLDKGSGPMDLQQLEHAPTSPCPHDRQLLLFYAEQCRADSASLLLAADALRGCLAARRQPPREVALRGRAVALAAHRLVFAGDALARAARLPAVRAGATRAADATGALLRDAVDAVSLAALRHPEGRHLREAALRVAELASHSRGFTGLLERMAAM